jgi:RecA/RadA recombinase
MQLSLLRTMISDAELFTRVINIFNPDNFDKTLRPVAKLLKEHSDKYRTLPDPEIIKASTGVEIQLLDEVKSDRKEWFLDKFEAFTKKEELERAIVAAFEMLQKDKFESIEKLVKDAVQISLTRDMGTDYFDSPSKRLEKYFSSGGQVSTGWPQLDKLLHGGFSRGELNIFAGGSGSGKSLVMMNIALNWLQMGLNGVYITLELSEELTGLRTDAMLTNRSTKDIRKDIGSAELMIKMVGKKSGNYQIKALPAQSNINHVRAFLKEFEIASGQKLDFVMIDYLDLLMPVSAKVSPSDLFVKDKYVSEELRNLAKELGMLMVTASQLNRTAVDEIEFDHSHISGGISKINTADNVFGIFTSRSMRERGQYQLQCMKSRSSTGVGQKIELEYNVETMRISDPNPEGETSYTPKPSANDIMNKLKPQSIVTSTEPIIDQTTGEVLEPINKKVVGDVQGSKLKSLLNSLKK